MASRAVSGHAPADDLTAEDWSDLCRVVAVSVVIGVLRRAIAGTATPSELIKAHDIAEALARDLVDSR